MRDVPIIPMGDDPGGDDAAGALLPRPWQTARPLSSTGGERLRDGLRRVGDAAEGFLVRAGYDSAPWLVVAFGGGILAWFALPAMWYWLAAMTGGGLLAAGAYLLWRPGTAADEDRAHLRLAAAGLGIAFALGIAAIWIRSEIVGAEPIPAPSVERLHGRILVREDQPAEQRIRLTLAVRDAQSGEPHKVRVNVPLASFGEGGIPAGLTEGAVVRLRARLMPPASPLLPGAYDFARAAWFKGIAGTGTALGPVELVEPALQARGIASVQRELAAHVRSRVDGSAGAIAAAFASGDRGSIARSDEDAMRDSGLTHLLSISGLHVSAVIAAAYFAAMKLLALWPALALRVRLPIVAAGAGALTGVGYTILTGAEVPTVRSCAAALLVLGALVLGREALSMRMVAVAAGFVLLLWPESAIGPSFQMSFAAVTAIVALSASGPVRAFLAPRDESWSARLARQAVMLFATGVIIEMTLMPIVLYHFHRAGFYGSLANVIAIPLVTFVSMPLIALGLLLDLAGLGAPCWWVVQQSLDLLLAIAHFTADRPGAVRLMPQISDFSIVLFAGGALWLGLWRGRARLLGLSPVLAAAMLVSMTPVPDVLIASDGRQVGITANRRDGERALILLRDTQSSFARDNLLELAGVAGKPVAITALPAARCSSAFCTVTVSRRGRDWVLMLGRGKNQVEERSLAAACARADIVISERYLPRSCRPQWLKADRRMLDRSGGLALHLEDRRIVSVADRQGSHGWWKKRERTWPERKAPTLGQRTDAARPGSP